MLNFQTMFVGAGEKMHLVTEQTMPTTYSVGDDCGIGVTNMWLGIHIIDGCRGAEFGDRT